MALLPLIESIAGSPLGLHPDVVAWLSDPSASTWRARAAARVYDGAGAAAAWLRAIIGCGPAEIWEAYAGDVSFTQYDAGETTILERRGILTSRSIFARDPATNLLVERTATTEIRWRVTCDAARRSLVFTSADGGASLELAPHPHHRRCVLITASVTAAALPAGALRIAAYDARDHRRPIPLPATPAQPLRIAVLGGGLAGLAAAHALAASARAYNRRIAGTTKRPLALAIDLYHLGRELGGKVQSVAVDVSDTSMNARQPARFHMTHGLHFVWGYPHFRELLGPWLCARTLAPARGTSAYVTWLSNRDTIDGRSRLTILNVCDPARPDDARIPENRTFLRLMQHAPAPMLELVQIIMRVDVRDFLHFGDILFNRRELSAVARWMLLFGAINARRMGDPEHWIIPGVRGALKDKEYLDAIGTARRAWITLLDEELEDLSASLRENLAVPALGSLGDLAGRTGRAIRAWSTVLFRSPDDVSLLDIAALVRLLVSDAVDLVRAADDLDFSKYAYLRVPLDAAFSSPYPLDAATAIRDTKFGTRTHRDSLVQVFDGDDPRAVCDAIAARIDGDADGVIGKIHRLSPVRALRRESTGALTVEVWPELTSHPATWRPIVHPYPHSRGAPPVPLDRPADLVISTLPAPNLTWVIDDSPSLGAELAPLREDAAAIGRATNETLNLQLFFRERIALPFPDYVPPAADPPFSISGIEGPFTILVDLRRAFSPARFAEIRLLPGDGPFDGTAWDLVGAYPELFTHNFALDAARQWPPAVQDELRRLLHDPDDIDPNGRDERSWAYDWTRGRPQPIFGEVLAARSALYGQRWRERAAPLIVRTAVAQLLELPGWDATEKRKLEAAIREDRYWFALTRNCHEHNKFVSTEPGTADRRPHARFETRAENLYLAGDWTRNGSNMICMDSTVASGLQAAAAILERLQNSDPDWSELELPNFHPESIPGGWDESP